MIKTIYAFWTGNNAMNESRTAALCELYYNCGVKLQLVTPANLNDFIKEPLHPAYRYLSNVHKSDYLRAYFMHNYGGGYSDIKACKGSWELAFDRFERGDTLINGYRELSPSGVAPVGGKLQQKLMKNYRTLIGCGAFIAKPATEFTGEWMKRLHAKLDDKFEQLVGNKGNALGNNNGYPLLWTEIMGSIFHPLCLEFSGQIGYDDSIMPDFHKHYR